MRWSGWNAATVIRTALKLLHDKESKRHAEHDASDRNTRKR